MEPKQENYTLFLVSSALLSIQSTELSNPTNNSKLKKYIYIICGLSSLILCNFTFFPKLYIQ